MTLLQKAVESLILTILAFHNMLMTSSVWGIYCPAVLADTDDVNRELPQGRWGNDTCVQSTLSLETWAKGHNASIAAKKNSGYLR